MLQSLAKVGMKQVNQTALLFGLRWILPGSAQCWVLAWMADQMGSKCFAKGLVGKLRL